MKHTLALIVVLLLDLDVTALQAAHEAAIKNAENHQRDFKIEKHYLNLPVKTGSPKRIVTVWHEGTMERKFQIELADSEPDFWVPLNVTPWQGKTITLQVDSLSEGSKREKSPEPPSGVLEQSFDASLYNR